LSDRSLASSIRSVKDQMHDAHKTERPEASDRAKPGRQRARTDPATGRSGASSPRPGGVQAVERACRLLIEVIRAAEPLPVGELSRRTGLHQSRTTGETINLSVPVAGQLVDNIAQVDAPHFLTTTNWVGRLIPLHCSSPGKVFLAYGVAELPSGTLARFTPQTITDRRALSAELKIVRRRGFATLIDELEPGLRAVAVPVVDGQGEVVAAVAVSGPSVRLPKRRLAECAEFLSEASVALTARLTSAWPQRANTGQPARRGSCLGPC